MRHKIAFVFGTRPEIIKIAPLIWACEKSATPFVLIHCGQHYSDDMDKVFFELLQLPEPTYRLAIGEQGLIGHGAQTGALLQQVEEILRHEEPDFVIVQGDTNSVLAGALVSAKMPAWENGKRCRLVHVEAGLRSYDRTMPEEINRIIVDHISDVLFVPTETQKSILLSEGISADSIFVVGNTIVDVVTHAAIDDTLEESILGKLGVESKQYLLLTLHRQENVDRKEVLEDIVEGIRQVAARSDLPIIFPIHPRTAKKVQEFNLELPERVITIPPINYLECIELEKNAFVILTDSGGVQEEACILQIPCITLRNSTERPETVLVGANYIAGTTPSEIVKGYEKMKEAAGGWKNPFGDGKTGVTILEILQTSF